ncbi:gastrula zinc finger protein XlCGF8.2DB-like isoform X2 [Hyperolius riggenbachi]|uniref:gastrula zinc finger protein XlCGF8.2DB-like isoform X2 n=1 Tax=Hyperolius riggenbachi TaxID=752182 RepID=UPI0035A2DD18
MEHQPPPTSPGELRNPPERCTGPLYFPKCKVEESDLQETMTAEPNLKEEEEEIPIDTRSDESNNSVRARKHLEPRPSNQKDQEDEEDLEDDEDSQPEDLHVVVKSELDDQEGDMTIKEEEAEADATLANFEKTYRAMYESRPKDHMTVHKPGDAFEQGQKIFTINHRTVTDDKPFSCAECGGLFKHKSSLVLHRRIHSGEKPYSCSECGKQFIQKANYLRHQRLHTGEKPYQCMECGKQYAQKQSLVMHHKFHAENEPFSCPECGASFIRQSHLVNHRKTHKGLRRYTCPDCGDFFMLRSSLVIHQRVHSAERPFSS